MGFPGDASGKECLPVQEMQEMWVPSGSGRSPGGGNGNPLKYACLENPMGRGAWQAIVHGVGVAKESDTTEPLTLSVSQQKGKRELSDTRQ